MPKIVDIFFRQGKCIQYIYGGCFGTENLFDTQSLCEARCPPLTAAPRPAGGPPTLSSMWIQPPLCQQGPMQADFQRMCMAYMPKFTYNETEGTLAAEMFGVGDFWLKTRIIIKILSHP